MPGLRWLVFFAAVVVPARAQSREAALPETPSPSPYDADTALAYASLAVAAFCGYPHFPDGRLLEAWQCGPPCDSVPDMQGVRYIQTARSGADGNNAFAFVGRRSSRHVDECVVSFRGTDNFAGWITDLESGRSVTLDSYGIPCEWEGFDCRVGYGFIRTYMDMREFILGNLTDLGCEGKKVSVAGHSLGAAISIVALYDLRTQGYAVSDSYTFGQPRVGNFAFVNALHAALAGEARVFRITHHKDPVPHLPFQIMGFRHHAREIYYDNSTTDGVIICDGSGEDKVCANQWINFPALLAECLLANEFGICDHMNYMTGSLPYNMGPQACADPAGLVGGGTGLEVV